MLARVLHLAVWRASRGRPASPLVLEAARDALARAERVLAAPAVLPPPAPITTPSLAKVIVLRPPPPPLATSSWDPEPVTLPSSPQAIVRRDEELVLQEINGCKTLLLEIVRRAAYDWVLYRTSRRMVHRTLADQAHEWLFAEVPGHASWSERGREGKHITSFVAICESLDLDPDTVRRHIRRLTPKNVMSIGRPAEYRRRDVFASRQQDEDVYSIPDSLVGYEASGGEDEGPIY